jgi:hypothetical protein
MASLPEAHGYTVELDIWDWPVGSSFIQTMNRALQRADRVLLLMSPTYFDPTRYTTEEWSATAVLDHVRGRKLVPVRIAVVDRTAVAPLLADRIYIDLVDLPPERAERELLDQLIGKC